MIISNNNLFALRIMVFVSLLLRRARRAGDSFVSCTMPWSCFLLMRRAQCSGDSFVSCTMFHLSLSEEGSMLRGWLCLLHHVSPFSLSEEGSMLKGHHLCAAAHVAAHWRWLVSCARSHGVHQEHKCAATAPPQRPAVEAVQWPHTHALGMHAMCYGHMKRGRTYNGQLGPHTHPHVHMHTHMHAHTHTHSSTHTQACTHTQARTHIHAGAAKWGTDESQFIDIITRHDNAYVSDRAPRQCLRD